MSSLSNKELEKRRKESKKIYCGDQEILPRGYWNFGTRSECTRRGVGIGLYVIPKQKSIDRKTKDKEREKLRKSLQRRRRTIEIINSEDELDVEDEDETNNDLSDKNSYISFMDDNFSTVQLQSKNPGGGDIFKKLGELWKLKYSIKKQGYKDRKKSRKEELKNLRSG